MTTAATYGLGANEVNAYEANRAAAANPKISKGANMEIIRSIRAIHLGKRLILDGRPFIGGIVLHDTAGSGTHNDTLYLANPGDGRTVSVDYTVERDGSVYELNPDVLNKCTFHAGRATKWKAGGRVFRNRAVTQVMIGIELVHKNDPSKQSPLWPADQVQAAAELCFSLCDIFRLTKDQITTHQAIITDGSRSDPRAFPFSEFWFYFNKTANVPAIDPPAGTLGAPIFHEVAAGDSLWKIATKYATTVEAIKALNGIAAASNLIRPGQKLIIKR